MIVCRYGYDGTSFQGFTREPGRRTVEGRVLDSLREVRALVEGAHPTHASRTDRGVSALGNVFSYEPSHGAGRTGELLRGANALLAGDGIHIWGYAEAHRGFDSRRAAMRTYVYFLFPGDPGISSGPAVPGAKGGSPDPARLERLNDVLGLFLGEHDFARFSRRDRSRDVSTVRSIEHCGVHTPDELPDVLGAAWDGPSMFTPPPAAAIVVRSRGFMWNQVRRMVGAGFQCLKGRVAAGDIRRALAGEGVSEGEGDGESMGATAAPQPLVLWDVAYGPPLTYRPVHEGGRANNTLKVLDRGRRTAWVRMNVLGALGRDPEGHQ